jgi:hypothetical protein
MSLYLSKFDFYFIQWVNEQLKLTNNQNREVYYNKGNVTRFQEIQIKLFLVWKTSSVLISILLRFRRKNYTAQCIVIIFVRFIWAYSRSTGYEHTKSSKVGFHLSEE